MPTRKNVDSITRTNNLKLTDFSFSNTPVSREGLKSLTLKPRFKKSSYRKLTSSFLIFAMLFQIIGGVFLSVPTEEAQASPSDWLTGYNYRTPVLIDNNNETALTDYQTKITLQGTDPTASNYIDFDKVLPNGADLRITDSDKVTQIPYWIESWDDTAKTATVWTKVPDIPVSSTPPYYRFSTSQTNHDDYGLSYPVTYEFNIPAGSSNLQAYKKYTEAGSWTQIEEKTSTDFFNGIEAVRFDYTNNKAYVSVAFDANSNDIYLKVVDGSDSQVGFYQKIDKYYDNRQAAVVSSGDDWRDSDSAHTAFGLACDMFTLKNIWFTPGIITLSGGIQMSQAEWDNIQSKINAGYVEPASHSRLHSKNAEGLYAPYADTESEIDGSKHDLIDHLDFPDLNKKGSSEYLYVFLEPGGKTYSEARQQLGVSRYLIDRSVATSVSNFMSWDSANGLYNRVGYSINMGTDGTTDLATLNSAFDSVYNSGGIYHLMFHPANVDWTPGQYADQHTDYIKGKKDVWYAGLGHLYLYNFTREKASRGVLASGKNIYLYYGKAGENNVSNYNSTFTKNYGEPGLVGLWHMDETLGTEELADGGLESWTNSTVLTNWLSDGVSAGVTDITQESTNKQAGSSSLKLTATNNTAAANFGVWQDITIASNQDYQVNLYQYYATHTAAAGTLKIEAYDNTNSVSLGSQSITTPGTALSYTSFRFTTGATTASVKIKVYLNAETAGIAYVDSISVKQSSKTLTDSSGNSNSGTINGASRTDTDGGQWGSRSNTIFSTGSALQFDGVDDYVNCGDGSTLNISSVFTIETWLNSNVISGYGYIVTRESGTSATGSGYSLYRGGNYLNFRVFDSSHNQAFVRTAIVANKTYHVVAVYADGQIMLYLDGTLAGKTDITGFSPWFTKNLTIGKRSSADSYYFSGVIDEVRMYNRALSSDEILAQYQRRKFISLEPFTDFSVLHTPSNLYKGATNTISATNNYVTYSSDPVIDNLVNMRVTSSLGIVEVSINTWRTSDDYYKKWTESGDTTTSHVIGDLKPNTRYILMVNGQEINTYLSDPQGYISFDYSGGYSTKTFELEETPSSVFIAPSKPNVSNLNIALNNGTLSLDNLPDTITQIAISTSPDFTNSSWEDISKKDDLLKQYTNTDTLYIKFRTQEGGASDTIVREGNNIAKDDVKDGNVNTGSSNQSLQDGDIVKSPSSPDIYVIKYKNNKQYKRLLLSPTIFNSYLHLKWDNIKTVSQQQLDQYQTSTLVKETVDTIIYLFVPSGDTGKKHLFDITSTYDIDSIYTINKTERDSYEMED